MKHRPVALTGMKHTGKTTIARLLAARLGVPSYDTDVLIAELSGKTPRELADEGGSELMHSWETRAIETLRDRLAGRQAIIATGGGLADNADGFAALKELGACVYLDTDFDTLYDRIEASAQRDGRMPSFLRGPNHARISARSLTAEPRYMLQCVIFASSPGVRGRPRSRARSRST
jgi:shikimate kinase